MLAHVIVNILENLIWLVWLLVIIQFIMSLLISFNVVNMHNRFVESLWHAINILLDPLLNPIRRIMPHTGAIDFSPMVLLFILYVVGQFVPLIEYYA